MECFRWNRDGGCQLSFWKHGWTGEFGTDSKICRSWSLPSWNCWDTKAGVLAQSLVVCLRYKREERGKKKRVNFCLKSWCCLNLVIDTDMLTFWLHTNKFWFYCRSWRSAKRSVHHQVFRLYALVFFFVKVRSRNEQYWKLKVIICRFYIVSSKVNVWQTLKVIVKYVWKVNWVNGIFQQSLVWEEFSLVGIINAALFMTIGLCWCNSKYCQCVREPIHLTLALTEYLWMMAGSVIKPKLAIMNFFFFLNLFRGVSHPVSPPHWQYPLQSFLSFFWNLDDMQGDSIFKVEIPHTS